MTMPFSLGAKYNFNTLAPAQLETSYKNATVVAIMDYTLVSQYMSPEVQHANIFPLLPPGTIDDPKKYTYILFVSEAGIKRALALEWIDIPSIVLVTTQRLQLEVRGIGSGDTQRIRDALSIMGFHDITATIV